MSWWRNWRDGKPVKSKEVLYAEELVRTERALLARIQGEMRELRDLQGRLADLSSRMEATSEAAEEVERRHQVAIEAIRSKNMILEDVVVPTLVQSAKVFEERYKAQTQIEVMRQVAASPDRGG